MSESRELGISDPGQRRKFRRPSLERLTADQRDVADELVSGFDSREEVLRWSQRLTVMSLGQLRDKWYLQLAEQYVSPDDGPQRTIMAALLTERTRRIELSSEAARNFRAWVAAETIIPAFHVAFRQLRKSATEYVGEGKEPQHDPETQQYIAMRPGLNELKEWQERALNTCLQGISNVEEMLWWREELELATHGEIDGDFVPRCVREPSTNRLLHPSSHKAAREAWAARHLIPAFNAGARDLFGRSGEEAESIRTYEDEPASW